METRLEYILTNSYKNEMISYISSNPEEFEEIIKLALKDKQPYSWRAAWLLWSCMEKNDPRVHKYVKKIIIALPTIGDQQQRELLKTLQNMDLDDVSEGKLFDICISIWEKTGKNQSVRYNAFKLITKIAKKYPELADEVLLLTDSQYLETLSSGVRKSVINMVS